MEHSKAGTAHTPRIHSACADNANWLKHATNCATLANAPPQQSRAHRTNCAESVANCQAYTELPKSAANT